MDDSIIKEGLVFVHRKGADNKVLFYNPAQVFNRDLSIIVLKTFILLEKKKIESNPKLGKFVGVNILETLAATGIRGIRYYKELGELVNVVTLNDLDRGSAEMIVKNANLNKMPRNKYRVTCCDGNLLSYILTPPPDVAKYFQMAGNIFKIPSGSINSNSKILEEFNKTVDSFLKIVSVSKLGPNQREGEVKGDQDELEMEEQVEKDTKYNKKKEYLESRKEMENQKKEENEVKMEKDEEKEENQKEMENLSMSYRNIVDVVDIDPYSSATGFIDSAVRSVRSGGIVLITSTDMPTLCGNNPLVAFYKYGGTSFKSPFCHELSLRVLLYSIMLTCSRYKRVIEPLLSVSIDFYVRVFVKVKYSPEGCSNVGSNSGMVLMCVQCHSYKIVKLCEDFIYLNSKDLESDLNGLVDTKSKVTGRKTNGVDQNINGTNGIDGNKDKRTHGNEENNGINGKISVVDGNEDVNMNNDSQDSSRSDVRFTDRSVEYISKNRKKKRRRVQIQSNLSRVCEECGGRMKMGGPLYTGPLHDKAFVESCLDMNKDIFGENNRETNGNIENINGNTDKRAVESNGNIETNGNEEDVNMNNDYPLLGISMGKRVRGLLTAIKEEVDVPLYYSISDLCQIWNLTTISPILFKQILEKMGYKASNFHRDPNSIKTNAPNHVVMDIIRAHAKNSGKISNHDFLNREVDTLGIDLDLKVERVKQVPRWMPNPTSHWGPKKMHKACSSSIKY